MARFRLMSVAALAVAVGAAELVAQPCEWTALPDLDGVAGDIVVHDDGSGPAIYLSGGLRSVSSVYRWDGRSWEPVGALGGGLSTAMTTFDDGSGEALYAGILFAGKFNPDPLVHRWDGASWSPVGGGIQTGSTFQGISDLEVYDDGSGPALYASGTFTGANGNFISRWRGGLWEPVGNAPVGAGGRMAVLDDGSGAKLYVSGGQSPQRMWCWDGNVWEPAFASDGLIRSMRVFDDGSGHTLYVAGSFTAIGGIAADGLAWWDGNSWSGAGSVKGQASWVAVVDDGRGEALFVGGEFTAVNGVPAANIARKTPAGFQALGQGTSWPSTTACEFDDGSGIALYAVGGVFAKATSHFARWKCNTCYPDCDQSTGQGVLDIFDFLCFQDAFAAMDPYADCDGNSAFDIFDFLCFQDQLVSGCQ